jgi:cell division protein FtsW (lipid II flippase)
LLIVGVLAVFAVQTFLHMAISLRLAPITGLTLPLVSYGGSSMLSTLTGFGLVASVQMHPADGFLEGDVVD